MKLQFQTPFHRGYFTIIWKVPVFFSVHECPNKASGGAEKDERECLDGTGLAYGVINSDCGRLLQL